MTPERQTIMTPLTPEWFRAATQPRYAVDGTVTYVLTPPRSASAGAWFRLSLWALAIGCAVTPWFLFR